MEEPDVRAAALEVVTQIEEFEKPPEATPEVTAKEEAVQEAVRCPRCNYDITGQQTPVPSEEDRKEYVRCLLGRRTFVKNYPLFDGEVSVKFGALTSPEAIQMITILQEIETSSSIRQISKILRVKLLFYLRTLNNDVFEMTKSTTAEAALQEFETRFKGLGEDVPAMLTRVMFEFQNLLDSLPATGLDQNFWKGAGRS